VQPAAKAIAATQVQTIKDGNAKEDKDDKYKTDKTGQYVSKDVQVPDNGGKERLTRPKFDAADAINSLSVPPDEPCDPNTTDCGGTTTPTVTSTFVSSVGKGAIPVSYNPSGYIYALRVIIGDDPYIQPSIGHVKINADLNRGAGGKYIYLTFTRDTSYTKENYTYPETYTTPITSLEVVSYSQACWTVGSPYTCDTNPDRDWKYIFKFNDSNGLSSIPDLNDGAGGKYIFGHVCRLNYYSPPIKEVGVIYGNSSSITPPTGWVKVPGDLNENAGGDYIYFCYKK